MWARNQVKNQDASFIICDAREFALRNGLVMRYSLLSSENYVGQVPVTLFPSSFPKKLYAKCLELQPIVNELQLEIARDSIFVQESLRSLIHVDDFTRNLLEINETVNREGLAQPIFSCISRADYMLDQYLQNNRNELRARQVEVNTISSSLATQSCYTQRMHKYLVSKYNIEINNHNTTVPDNKSLSLVVQTLVEAYDLYSKSNCFVLMVTDVWNYNFSDILGIELAIKETRSDIRVVRRSFKSLVDSLALGPNKELLLDRERECAVVYFRCCYDPKHHEHKNAWETRLLIERSRALKCPSINFHLSGSKKFQQILNDQEKLERFLSSEKANELMQIFSKFWPLDDSTQEGRTGLELGLNSPKNFVLKPQREGGGHNTYGDDIKPFLENMKNSDEISQYILMEYINSPKQPNWLLLPSDNSQVDSNRLESPESLMVELGIYGGVLADSNTVYQNNFAGYLVRSKRSDVFEGGVARGFAGVSSLILTESLENEDVLSQFYNM